VLAVSADVRNGFGELLRSRRRAAGLSQEDLAERSGLSVRAVSDMERGRTTRPFSRSTRVLADALSLTGASREEFFAAATGAAPRDGSRPSPVTGAGDSSSGWSILPRQLPVGVCHFAGRLKELAALDELTGSAPLIVLSGTAGVGKTTLAVHWARQAADRFPDGQLYVDLRGFGPSGNPVTSTAAIQGFLAAFGVPTEKVPAGLEAQTALYRSLLASRRVLVVLDNARDAEQVRPLLPGGTACQVLVTSRDPMLALAAAEAANPMMLDRLGHDEACELLASRLGNRNLSGEQQALGQLAESCACLPLALSVAAARAAAHPEFPIDALAAELRGAGNRLSVLETWDPASTVRAAFSWSYRLLGDGAARLFRRLGAHPGPDITAAAAASLVTVSQARARQLLGELTSAHLLTEHAPGRFCFHALLRDYAVDLVRERTGIACPPWLMHRILDHYLHTAHAADRLLHPFRDSDELVSPPGVQVERIAGYPRACAWYRAERRVLVAVVGQAARAGEDSYVWRLARVLETYFIRHGLWQELAVVYRDAVRAAGRLGDVAAQAHSSRGLGLVCALLGSRDDARDCLMEALDLFGQLGDRAGQARTHTDAGVADGRAGRFGEALGHATRAAELYRRADHPGGLARALNNAGCYQIWLGHSEKALVCGEEALTIFAELGDRYGTAHCLDTLGMAHCALGDYARGTARYRESLALFREGGYRIQQAEVLGHLARGQRRAAGPGVWGSPRATSGFLAQDE
jgi:transcriptional regulator with XRE-family HTH domain/tetratricopeptide (TPR) repeat protein